mgnify:CR=1 FL=1
MHGGVDHVAGTGDAGTAKNTARPARCGRCRALPSQQRCGEGRGGGMGARVRGSGVQGECADVPACG